MSINKFEVSIYGNLTPFEKNPLLSSARVRIFYKGLNRNRTFIDDEFAEKLVASLPYTPISGIWDDLENDYTDHGETREAGRIYGLVPENPNVSWEDYLDEDGVNRTYCCCDVVLFTTRYEHANNIVGKPQSMELYDKSIKGDWMIYEGVKCYKFTDGCFIGLQVLGDAVEPCFEGAAFYTYANSLKEMIEVLKNYTLDGGTEQMPGTLNFKLSDREKCDAIWSLINPNYCEEGNWEIEYNICDIYDDYAIVYQYETAQYFRWEYKKDDKENCLLMGEKHRVFIMDITEAELAALNAIRELNGGNFVEIDSKYQSLGNDVSTLQSEKEENVATISSLNEKLEESKAAIDTAAETIATLNSKVGELNSTIEEKDVTINSLNEETSSLKEFKEGIERAEKKAEIAKYSMLGAEVVEQFSAKVDEYTLVELQNALKVAYVNANAKSIFSNSKNGQSESHFIPQIDAGSKPSGAAGLINKHKNGGNK